MNRFVRFLPDRALLNMIRRIVSRSGGFAGLTALNISICNVLNQLCRDCKSLYSLRADCKSARTSKSARTRNNRPQNLFRFFRVFCVTFILVASGRATARPYMQTAPSPLPPPKGGRGVLELEGALCLYTMGIYLVSL